MPEHRFALTATWDPATSEGRLVGPGESFSMVHTGAVSLGGKGGQINPEELLLAAVSSCFVQTWAIFLAKLKVPIEIPGLDGSCVVESDPAGGYQVSRIVLEPRIPAALWETRRAELEKTLSLAERYCIVSKAVRQGKDFRITPQIV